MSSRIKFVFTCLGTKGDILPLLAIAKEFKDKGNDVYFLSNEDYFSLVNSRNIDFHAIAPKELPQENSIENIFEHSILPSFEKSYNFIANLYKNGEKIVVINNGIFSGSNFACEKYGIPLVRIVLMPLLLAGPENLPYPFSAIKSTVGNWLIKRVFFQFFINILCRTTFSRRGVNKFRQEIGLPKKASLLHLDEPNLTLMAYPQWFAPYDAGMPYNHHEIGFMNINTNSNSNYEVSEAVLAHISKYGAPLIFTPGTGTTDTNDFFHTAILICDNLKFPGIFISPNVKNIVKLVPDNILLLEYADFDWVFGLAQVVFHHGGIGTVAHAISAGVLQVVIPERFDQPDNAFRIERLGLGIKVDKRNWDADKVSPIVRSLMDDKKIKENLKIAADRVNKQMSLTLAYDLILSSIEGYDEKN